MSAEAIARLRALLETPAYVDAPLGVVDLFASDLRALLDAHAALEAAHAEVLDALEPLYRKNKLREHGMGWKDRSKLPEKEAAKEWALSLLSLADRIAELDGANRYLTERLDATGDLLEQLEKAEAERDALKRELADLIPLAESAMRQANNDGAEYDIKVELADARRVAEANMQTAERASQSIDVVAVERDALRAQVEAARAECSKPHSECCDSDECADECEAATVDSIIEAMDGAKP